jgi:hypothetical protein
MHFVVVVVVVAAEQLYTLSVYRTIDTTIELQRFINAVAKKK